MHLLLYAEIPFFFLNLLTKSVSEVEIFYILSAAAWGVCSY